MDTNIIIGWIRCDILMKIHMNMEILLIEIGISVSINSILTQ